MVADSRKRTLERRIHTQHILKEKNNKKPINKDRKSPIFATSTPNKGNFSLFGRAISQDNEDRPEYAQLCVTVNENLLTTYGEYSADRAGSVPVLLHELLQKGDAAVKYMQGSRNMKIDNWILLDNYVQGRVLYSSSQTRALRIHSKRSKKHMSMKQHKKQGSLALPQELHNCGE